MVVSERGEEWLEILSGIWGMAQGSLSRSWAKGSEQRGSNESWTPLKSQGRGKAL